MSSRGLGRATRRWRRCCPRLCRRSSPRHACALGGTLSSRYARTSDPWRRSPPQMAAHAAEAMAAAAHDEYAEKSARKRIIRRYSSLPEPVGGPARGTPSHATRALGSPTRRAPPLPYTGTRAETIRQKVARYRDGQLVSYSSQKYGGSTASKFVEKPAWDGGSTGRVYLKRRGGVGSVMS